MKTSISLIHWTPRILAILAILFISLFALDAFDPHLTLGQQIVGFLMHMIPSFVLLAILIIAWRWELVGGIMFAAIGLGLMPFVFIHNFRMNQSLGMSLGIITLINLPFVIVGGLFMISHFLKKKNG
jgi:hypothetical protein